MPNLERPCQSDKGSEAVLRCLQYNVQGLRKFQNLSFKKCLLHLHQKSKFDTKKWSQFKFWKLKFLIFGLSRSNYVEKFFEKFFHNFFILYQKIPLVSSIENSPYFIFFPDWATNIYNFLLLRPCRLFILQLSQNHFGFFIRLVSSF